MAMIQPKHQRLALIALAMVALIGAALLAAWSLRDNANYFYVPDQMVADPPAPDRAVRLGGMVREGSIRTLEDGVTIAFVVADGEGSVPVRFAGIAPALFVEGSGVVAEGRLAANGTFVADNLLAKHDENYVPRELQEMSEHQAREVVADAGEARVTP